METKKVKYAGSANSIPKYGITMKDGEVLTPPKHIAEKLVNENIGFSFVETEPTKKETKKKKGED